MMSVLHRHFLVALSLLVVPVLPAQQDQLPRPPKKDDRGLFQINREYFDLAASTGGDYYFWAAGEFVTRGRITGLSRCALRLD